MRETESCTRPRAFRSPRSVRISCRDSTVEPARQTGRRADAPSATDPARRRANAVRERGLRQRHRDAAVGDIARGMNQFALRQLASSVCRSASASRSSAGGWPHDAAKNTPSHIQTNRMPPALSRLLHRSRLAVSFDSRFAFKTPEQWYWLIGYGSNGTSSFGSGSSPARHRPQQQDRVACLLEIRRHGLRHIVQNADDAQHRRGINSLARVSL